MSNIVFPSGVTWSVRYATGGDFLNSDIKIEGGSLYRYTKNRIIDIKGDISDVTQPTYMFENCSTAFVKNIPVLNIDRSSHMFNGAQKLLVAPQLDLTYATAAVYMFQNCYALRYIPPFEAPLITSADSMFAGCSGLTNVPVTDLRKCTTITKLFADCYLLDSIPDMNLSSATSFGSSYNNWLYGASSVRSIGVIDCDSITNIEYVFGNSINYRIKHLGGFRNLGKKSSVSGTAGQYFLNYVPNLTRESLINVFNELYDRASAGLSVLTLKLHANHRAILSDEDKAIATNKGWTLS